MIWFLPWENDESARHHPWATWTLIVVNVLVFLGMPSGVALDAWLGEWGLIAADPRPAQFLTSAFIHGGWVHLIGNLFFLWMFGDNVEDALGIVGFLAVYFLGGLAGDLLYVSANAHSIPSIGASGCIAAIAGAYAVMFFDRRVSLKVMIVVFPVYTLEMGAFWLLLLWFGVDVWLTAAGGGAIGGEGGVNYVAHGAGFAFGFAVGVLARLQGTMRRYALLSKSDPWWGYWPVRLEREHREEAARQQRMRQSLDAHARAHGDAHRPSPVRDPWGR